MYLRRLNSSGCLKRKLFQVLTCWRGQANTNMSSVLQWKETLSLDGRIGYIKCIKKHQNVSCLTVRAAQNIMIDMKLLVFLSMVESLIGWLYPPAKIPALRLAACFCQLYFKERALYNYVVCELRAKRETVWLQKITELGSHWNLTLLCTTVTSFNIAQGLDMATSILGVSTFFIPCVKV